MAYGREQEKLHDKNFRFTLTTNGVLLNDEIMEFANKEMANVVLSIDGRKEVNDRMQSIPVTAAAVMICQCRSSGNLQTAENRQIIMSEEPLHIII